MKKFILTMMLMFSMFIGVNAQTAIETPKILDNVYVGVEGGVTTPLSFSQPFKNINPVAGIVIGKDLTPVFGIQAEGMTWFQDHNFANSHTAFKAINVGVNGTVNLSNLFCGYNGIPRKFEVSTVTGLGWLSILGDPYLNGKYNNKEDNDELTAKTGINFAFNLGSKKQHQLYVQPSLMWNLTPHHYWDDVQFDKNHAQFALIVGYAYKFKTSNGTHNFKTYDVGAMQSEISRLNNELAKKPTEIIRDHYIEKVITKNDKVYIFFAQDSSVLTDEAKMALDNIEGTVSVVGSASPEGTSTYNKALSERRAAVVADYLTKRGVTVNQSIGVGVTGDTSARLVIVNID